MNHFLYNIDYFFSNLVTFIKQILFFEIAHFPVIIFWILMGGIFFTLRMGFINIVGFKQALKIVYSQHKSHNKKPASSKKNISFYKNQKSKSQLVDNVNYPDEIDSENEVQGEISSFQALTTALSASIGLGNISGVAIAIQLGGTGTVFWMTLAGIFGMSSKFVECTLGSQYRTIGLDGTTVGGPMYYLSRGLKEIGKEKLGKILAVAYCFAGIGAAIGGGNMFQVNQSFMALAVVFPALQSYDWAVGLVLAFLVGLVIIGGVSRIGVITSRLVPLMSVIYILGCLWILKTNFAAIPHAFASIFTEAFSSRGMEGGLVGIIIQGIRRSVFSNGAGLGSAAIAHAVAKTKEPIQEGIVSILEPFLDTVVICNLTALVIATTQVYWTTVGNGINGSILVMTAFAQVIQWSPAVLAGIMCMFGFSTMITWCYYGEQCWIYIFGKSNSIIFKIVFLFCIFIGSVVNLGAVLDFSDMMLLTLAIPNILGCILLSNKVAKELKKYWQKTITV